MWRRLKRINAIIARQDDVEQPTANRKEYDSNQIPYHQVYFTCCNRTIMTRQDITQPQFCTFCGKAMYNTELILQLSTVCDWLEKHSHKYCKCENNGDYCDFHEMLARAKEALS